MYTVCPDWIKNKNGTINPINNKDNRCFQYAVTVLLNHEEIKKDLQSKTRMKLFIDKYNWEGINYPSENDDWKKCEENVLTINLNVLYAKKEKIFPAYVSKHNSNHEKQVILLMISNGAGWYCLAVKKLSALLIGITLKHKDDFYCLKNKLESHKNVCENEDFCNIKMPSEVTKILEFNQYQRSDKSPFIIYADLECWWFKRLIYVKVILKIHLQQN